MGQEPQDLHEQATSGMAAAGAGATSGGAAGMAGGLAIGSAMGLLIGWIVGRNRGEVKRLYMGELSRPGGPAVQAGGARLLSRLLGRG